MTEGNLSRRHRADLGASFLARANRSGAWGDVLAARVAPVLAPHPVSARKTPSAEVIGLPAGFLLVTYLIATGGVGGGRLPVEERSRPSAVAVRLDAGQAEAAGGLARRDGGGDNARTMIQPLPQPAPRLVSIDLYRGGVMLLMLAEVLEFGRMAAHFPASPAWQWLGYHQSHVAWRGCSIHDMIQPSFSFLVGVALPFSVAGRVARGDSTRGLVAHAAWRSLVLIALGIFLRSVGKGQTNFTFEDTLTQIGLGYLPLFLIGLGPVRARWIALGAIVVGYWGAFALYPGPGADFDYASVGVPTDWPHHASGLAGHWNKNGNLAWAFDRWFLNLFPRAAEFTHNRGGYATLSFIPTLGTMLLGLIAGGWLRADAAPRGKLGRLALAGVAGIAAGWALDRYGICPIVKRIWTPSWVLFSGGICFLTLAVLYAGVDVLGVRRWAYPILIIGRNAIAAYCLAHLIEDFVAGSIRTHLGQDVFKSLGETYEPLLLGSALLAAYWLILFWMDRRRIYLKV